MAPPFPHSKNEFDWLSFAYRVSSDRSTVHPFSTSDPSCGRRDRRCIHPRSRCPSLPIEGFRKLLSTRRSSLLSDADGHPRYFPTATLIHLHTFAPRTLLCSRLVQYDELRRGMILPTLAAWRILWRDGVELRHSTRSAVRRFGPMRLARHSRAPISAGARMANVAPSGEVGRLFVPKRRT